MLKQKIAT